MKTANLPKLLALGLLFFTGNLLQGQIPSAELGGADLNTIQTAVPFLTISPDARASGIGDAGAASKADVNSQHWNVAKYPFMEKRAGVSLSYTPWLGNLVPGIFLGYISGYFKINEKNVVSTSFRYFDLGNIDLFRRGAYPNRAYNPHEFAVDAGYSRLFTDHFSGGVVFRYIRSDLTHGRTSWGGEEVEAANSIAGDLGLYYRNEFFMADKLVQWALGMNLSNLGTPIGYTEDADKTPIPSNMRLGGRFEYGINDKHSISLMADLNKLLVPTPALYDADTATGDHFIIRGKAQPKSILRGMLQSFSDAPGVQQADGSYSVFQEEIHEIAYSLGLEYIFKDLIALRSGYFHEHATKGNRKYWTFALGVMNPLFALELSYLVPTNGQNSPLANTFRLTFSSTFGHIPSDSPLAYNNL